MSGAVTVSNDVVLVAGDEGIEAFDASTGQPLWKRAGVLTFDNRYGTVGVQGASGRRHRRPDRCGRRRRRHER